MGERVIERGGEIHFTDDRDAAVPDKVTIHPSGWVRALHERSYKVEWFPPHKVDTIHTHTSDEEEEEFLNE